MFGVGALLTVESDEGAVLLVVVPVLDCAFLAAMKLAICAGVGCESIFFGCCSDEI